MVLPCNYKCNFIKVKPQKIMQDILPITSNIYIKSGKLWLKLNRTHSRLLYYTQHAQVLIVSLSNAKKKNMETKIKAKVC